MFEILTSNLQIIMPTLWAGLAAYATWYFARAKRYSPLTATETKQLWMIHRHDASCNSRKWRQIKREKLTVGFQCECGYTHVQKKPLVAHAPASLQTPRVSAFDKLHTSHKST